MTPGERLNAARLLAFPWTAPADAAPAPRPGEALLVGTRASTGGEEAVALLCARVGDAPPRATVSPPVALGPDVLALVAAARPVAWAASPFALRTEPTPPVSLDRVWVDPQVELHVAAGASYGLALALAHQSWWSQLPLPVDLLALATVTPEGQLGPVDQITAKLRVALQHAPRLRRVLVGPALAETARRALWDRPDIQVEAVPTLQAASLSAFAFALDSGEAPDWSESTRASGRARLLALVRDGRLPLPSWAPVERSLAALSEADPGDRLVHDGRLIAARHLGRPALIPIPTPMDLASLPRVRRLDHLAQVVQSHTDHGHPALAEVVALARGHVEPHAQRVECDLKLLGALGRAHALLGELAEGAALLREAEGGWYAIDRAEDASFAVSALLRSLALLGDTAAFEGVAQRWAQAGEVHPLSPTARAFVALEVGAGYALLGHPEDAAPAFDEVERLAVQAPAHVGAALWRWRRRTFGPIEAADPVPPTWAALAALDDALAVDDPAAIEAALAVLRADPTAGGPVSLLRSSGLSAREVADYFPY